MPSAELTRIPARTTDIVVARDIKILDDSIQNEIKPDFAMIIIKEKFPFKQVNDG